MLCKMRQLIKVLISTTFLILAMGISTTTLAADSKSAAKVPMGADGAQGSSTGLPDTFSGGMSYSIPIEVPPGRKGMDPGLALQYKSNNGDSWTGTGWELELGAIRRDFREGTNFNGNSFQLVNSGVVQDLADIGDGTYLGVIENNFSRIQQSLGQDGRKYWIVTDKGGTKFTYGVSAASRQDDPINADSIYKWCLDKVEDVNGNYITITYTKDNGQIYPFEIKYTGNSSTGVSPTNLVRFHLEPAPSTISFVPGFSVTTTKRLKTIEVKSNNQTMWAYSLDYLVSFNTELLGSSLLTAVQKFDRSASVDPTSGAVTNKSSILSLPPVTFTYNEFAQEQMLSLDSVAGPATTINSSSPGATSVDLSRVKVGDFNGDGKTDMAVVNGWGSYSPISIYLSNGNGFDPAFAGPTTGVSASISMASIDISRVLTGDFNGDGKTDIGVINGWGSFTPMSIYLSTGDGFDSAIQGPSIGVTASLDGARIDISRVQLADFNGDGKTDIGVINGWGGYAPMSIYLSTGTGFSTSTPGPTIGVSGSIAMASLDISRVRLGDFNGDRKIDIGLINGWGGVAAMTILLSKDDGQYESVAGPSISVVGNLNGAPIDVSRVKTGDFNGDGKTDIGLVNGWGGALPMSIFLSTGRGFLAATPGPTISVMATIDGARIDISRVAIVDYNGDGKSDVALMAGWGSPASMQIYMSKGNGFSTLLYGSRTDIYTEQDLGRFRFGDFAGNGQMGVAVILNQQTNVYVKSAAKGNTLRSIDNGTLERIEVEYKSSTNYLGNRIPFPVQTVSSIVRSDGKGNISRYDYDYENGYYDIGERDFRGFGYVKVMHPAGPSGEQQIVETWFHQGNDTDFDVDNPYVPTGYMKGKPYRVMVTDNSGRRYSEKKWKYFADNDGQAPFYTPVSQVDEFTYDASAAATVTRTVFASYDNYGNLVEERQYGDVDDPTDDKTVFVSYSLSQNNSSWIMALPSSRTVYEGIGVAESKKKAHTDFYYDGVGNGIAGCSQASTNRVPVKGNVTRTVSWNNTGGANSEQGAAYDGYGNQVCSRDANGYISTVSFDALNTFSRVNTNPLGHKTTTIYYGVDGQVADKGLYGQVKSVTDPNGVTTTYEYDTLGRNTYESHPSGLWKKTQYRNWGTASQNIRIDYPLGLWSEIYFDGLRRTVKKRESGPDGKVIVTETGYDTRGNTVRSSFPYFEGQESPRYKANVYDAVGRIIKSYNEAEKVASTVQKCYGNNVSVTIDANNHRKRETFDVYGNLVRVDEYTGTYSTCSTDVLTPYATTRYRYDVTGNLRFVTDAKNNQTEMVWDSLGRKISMRDPDMGAWSYEYDPKGNLRFQTDAKSQRIEFRYDPLDRLLFKIYPDQRYVSYVYDQAFSSFPKGRLTTMGDASGVTYYYYDNTGNATTVSKVDGAVTYAMNSTYDALGRMLTLQYPDGETVAFSYNGPKLWKAGNYATFTGYNALGQKGAVTTGNGVTNSYSYYSENNRLKTIAVNSPTQGSLVKLTYSYYNIGTVKNIVDNISGGTRGQSFTYDALDRLTSATGVYGPLTYSYDEIGNIKNKEGITFQYQHPSKSHALTSTSSGRSFVYDNNGNAISDGVRTYVYNYDNLTESINGGAVRLVYDGSGSRAKKITAGDTKTYIGKYYECVNGVCGKYVFADGDRIALKTQGQTLYYHPDHLSSSVVITDATGSKVEELGYYPYGKASKDVGNLNLNHKFTGQEHDAETNLYNYGARLYDPEIGRFITPDTIVQDYTDPQTLNRYSYARNNPLLYTDPSGHFFLVDDILIGAAIGAAIGATSSAITGGDIGMGALTGAITGGIFGGAGWAISQYGFNITNSLAQTGIHMAAGAASGTANAAVMGGDVGMGAAIGGVSAGVTKFAGGFLPKDFGSQLAGRTVIGGMIGGTVAEISGGTFGDGFKQGAITSAIGLIANEYNPLHRSYGGNPVLTRQGNNPSTEVFEPLRSGTIAGYWEAAKGMVSQAFQALSVALGGAVAAETGNVNAGVATYEILDTYGSLVQGNPSDIPRIKVPLGEPLNPRPAY